jgi:hypothetical protein
MKSAMRPRIVKEAQKIFRSIYQVYRLCQASKVRGRAQGYLTDLGKVRYR